MSQYRLLPQDSTSKLNLDDEDILESLQNIPSHFDLALNGGPNRAFLSPNPRKDVDASLLDPEAFRRLSISSVVYLPTQDKIRSQKHGKMPLRISGHRIKVCF
jgi:hypothetical protein